METVFISYSSADRRWAEWIGWHFKTDGHRAILQAWDFQTGSNFVLEMQKAATLATRTIAVFSEAYLKSPFTAAEWATAFGQDPTGEKRILVPVRIENCKPAGLLRTIVYIDIFGVDEETARSRLLARLKGGRAKPTEAPPFPGESGSGLGLPPGFPGGRTQAAKTGATASMSAATAGLAVAARPTEEVEVEIPDYLAGLTASQAKLRFRIATAPATLAIAFQQDQPAFTILETDPATTARKTIDQFEIQIASAGEHEFVFDFSAIKLQDVNNLVTVVITRERVLFRRTYRITAFSGKPETKVSLILMLLRWARNHWKWLALTALVLIVGFLYVWRHKGEQDWATTLGLRAPDYIRSGGTWSSDFQSDHWVRKGSAKTEPGPGHPGANWLTLDGAGAAAAHLTLPGLWQLFPRDTVLVDFEAVFNISFRQDGTAGWVFRGRPDAAGWNGYHFLLQRQTTTTGGRSTAQFMLKFQRCGASNACMNLSEQTLPFCSACDNVQIRAHAVGGQFRIMPAFLSRAAGCNSITDEIDLSFKDPTNMFHTGQVVFLADDGAHFDVSSLLLGRIDCGLFPGSGDRKGQK